MKKLLLLPLVGALAMSCDNGQKESTPIASPLSPTASVTQSGRLTGKLNVSSLAKLSKVSLVSELKLSLLTVDGKLVERMSDLQPNTDYKIIVEGSNDLQVRACLGFDLLEQVGQSGQAMSSNSFSIRTHSDVLESPMISLVPLRRVGNVMFREQAQMLPLIKKG